MGQNPLAPTSANERVAGKEDRIVRRGIDTLQKRMGSHDNDSSESELEDGRKKGKGKAMEVITEGPDGEVSQLIKVHAKKTKQKKVS